MYSISNPYATDNALTEEQQEQYDKYEKSFNNWVEENKNRPCKVYFYPGHTSSCVCLLEGLARYFDLEEIFSDSKGEGIEIDTKEDFFGIYWKNYYESGIINSITFEIRSGERIGEIDSFSNLVSLYSDEVRPAKGWKVGIISGNGYIFGKNQTLAEKDSRWEKIDDLESFYNFIKEQSSDKNLVNNTSYLGEVDEQQDALDAIFVKAEFAEVFQNAVTAFLDELEN